MKDSKYYCDVCGDSIKEHEHKGKFTFRLYNGKTKKVGQLLFSIGDCCDKCRNKIKNDVRLYLTKLNIVNLAGTKLEDWDN